MAAGLNDKPSGHGFIHKAFNGRRKFSTDLAMSGISEQGQLMQLLRLG
jgi:hypothetical protein